MSDSLVVVLTGVLAAVACALPGCFLVLRRMALLGDAICHAVLPGLVVAFLWTGSLNAPWVVTGAAACGLLTVFLIESLHRTRRVREDASIAVVFPALFAVGVLLVSQYAGQKDLDQECVLYGEIAYAPLDLVTVAGIELPRPLLFLGGIAAINLLFVVLLYKELKLATFDEALAASLGISPVLVHYLLMGTVSITTVASFESVGAILVVAFLVVPPAAAYLLTDRLHWMLLLAAGIGALSCVAGYLLARELDASIAGCMAVCMGVAFGLVWVAAPREGLLGRLLRRRRSRRRFAQALVLERLGHAPATADALARDLAWSRPRIDGVLAALRVCGYLDGDGRYLRPTARGLAFVEEVVG